MSGARLRWGKLRANFISHKDNKLAVQENNSSSNNDDVREVESHTCGQKAHAYCCACQSYVCDSCSLKCFKQHNKEIVESTKLPNDTVERINKLKLELLIQAEKVNILKCISANLSQEKYLHTGVEEFLPEELKEKMREIHASLKKALEEILEINHTEYDIDGLTSMRKSTSCETQTEEISDFKSDERIDHVVHMEADTDPGSHNESFSGSNKFAFNSSLPSCTNSKDFEKCPKEGYSQNKQFDQEQPTNEKETKVDIDQEEDAQLQSRSTCASDESTQRSIRQQIVNVNPRCKNSQQFEKCPNEENTCRQNEEIDNEQPTNDEAMDDIDHEQDAQFRSLLTFASFDSTQLVSSQQSVNIDELEKPRRIQCVVPEPLCHDESVKLILKELKIKLSSPSCSFHFKKKAVHLIQKDENILIPCVTSSRVGSDVEIALRNAKLGGKKGVLLILNHHAPHMANKMTPTKDRLSDETIQQQCTAIVDIVFWQKNLSDCPMNNASYEELKTLWKLF